jgi:PAS domain S-box-containing protein
MWEQTRFVCSEVLAREAHRVIFVSRGEEALAVLQREPFEILLVELPESGEEDRVAMLSALGQRGGLQQITVVVMTRSGAGILRQRAFDAGVMEFLSMPVDAIELASRVWSILELRRARALIASLRDENAESERYHSIVDSATEGIATTDAEGRLDFANPKAAEMFGYTVNEMSGLSLIDDFAADEHSKRLVQESLERIRQGAVELQEFLVRRKDGTEVWVLTTGRPLYVGGRYAGVVGTVRDITRRHKVEEALQASEQRLSLAMVAADLGLWDWNVIADTAYLSPEYLGVLGLGESEIRSASTWFRDRVHPDDIATVSKTIQEHLQGKSSQSIIEYRARRESGEHVWLRGIGRVVARDATGVPLRMMGVIVDISEQKHTEDLLRAAIEVRDNVIAIVSHDLRNPLSAIRLSASLLTERAPDLDRRRSRKQLEVILRSAEHMHRIIDKVLDASTIEAGTFALDYEREEVFPIVDELVQQFEPVAASKSIRLVREVLGEVPPMWCDRTRVQQLLSNLIGNALKAVPVHGMIRVRVWAQTDEVHFEVTDTGPGIPERALSHLFERYWTADPGQRRGTGLGLFISKGIVDAHGGLIFVETKIGGGSTFHFTIPVSPATKQVTASVH